MCSAHRLDHPRTRGPAHLWMEQVRVGASSSGCGVADTGLPCRPTRTATSTAPATHPSPPSSSEFLRCPPLSSELCRPSELMSGTSRCSAGRGRPLTAQVAVRRGDGDHQRHKSPLSGVGGHQRHKSPLGGKGRAVRLPRACAWVRRGTARPDPCVGGCAGSPPSACTRVPGPQPSACADLPSEGVRHEP